ncbi:matrin 3-like 1.1 isoform X2 [Clupea harengus]|uniref:Matrin 3-like 1.1 isoform X2 n=1 Tax=Clupea harengus TaxID=7950 RepID=A0A6P8EPL3_CLUHA|nr:matrin 3-like 1.1 isoform X2 [Clupea harengus]
MSQNHPYRSSRTGYRSRDDFYEDSGSQYTGQRDVYQTPRDLSPAPSYQPSSHATEPHPSMRPDVINILDSCGLEPNDLSLLAELPEDLITVDTLPHLLKKIRDSKEQRLAPPASTSHFTTSAPAPAYERKRLSHPAEYRSDRSSHPTPASSHDFRETRQDHGIDQRHSTTSPHHPRQRGAPSYAVEYGQTRHEDSHYDHATVYSSEPRQSHISSSSRRDIDYRHKSVIDDREPPHISKKDTHHTLPLRKEASDFHGKTPPFFPYACQLCNIVVLSDKDWNQHINAGHHADSQLKLLQRYPAWDCHINLVRRGDDHPPERPAAPDHAKPAKPQKRSSQPMEGPSNNKKRPNLKKVPDKPMNGGKVISVKFTAKSIDEDYLRRLLGQFGAIIKIIFFPSLAFVEMGSKDQAGDIEKYFSSNPLEVERGQVVFSVSDAFKFLKSSKVVCFSPLPSGGALTKELNAVAKGFGPLKNTLLLPSRAYIEMVNEADAEALVDHHASKPLKLRGSTVHVDFSSEYETLENDPPDESSKCSSPERHAMRSPSPKKSPKSRGRSRSPSPKRSPKSRGRSRSPSPKRSHKSRGRSQSPSPKKSPKSSGRSRSPRSRGRSRSPRRKSGHRKDSKEKECSSQRRSSSGPREEKPKGQSHGSPPEPVPQKVSEESVSADAEIKSEEEKRSVALDAHDSDSDLEGLAVIAEDDELEDVEVLDVVDSEGEENKEDGEQVASSGTGQDGAQEMKEAVIQEKAGAEVVPERAEEQITSEGLSRASDPDVCEEAMDSGAVVACSTEQEQETRDAAEVSGEKETDPERPSQSKKEVVEETSAGDQENGDTGEDHPGKTTSDVEDAARDVEKASQDVKDGAQEMEEEEEDEFEFPENLITLDEIHEDSSEEQAEEKNTENPAPYQRVFCLRNLPQTYYTDEEFWKIGKKYGKVAHYFLIRNRCEGFIEMENSEDARKAVSDLTRRKFVFNGYPLEIALSWKYKRLVNAWVPEPEKKHKNQSSKSRESKDRSRSRSASKEKTRSKQSPTESKDRMRSKRSPTESKDKKSEQSKQRREDSEGSTEKSRDKSNKEKSPNKDSSQKSGEESKLTVKEESASTDKACTDKQNTTAGHTIEARKEEDEGHTIEARKEEDDSFGQYQPNNPVGQEFVRPVVGYFCNLCNLIYATEEEAKNEHCSSLSHFRKLKEHEQKKA